MPYKNVLVHCNDKRRLPSLLEPAVALCSDFDARLVGISVTPPIAVIPAGIPGTPDTIVVDAHCKAYRAENPEMKVSFEAAARARNVAAEWREDDAGSGSVAKTVLRHARAAGLLIAAQSAPEWMGSLALDIPDTLALESGRPVLIIPNKGMQHTIGKRVVVAWTNRREAVRALFDAIPFLRRADKVILLEVDPAAEEAEKGSRLDVCATLALYDVACGAETAKSRHGNVGDALLAGCERAEADLLVMGCYGHSRLREVVFGGATRHILADMTVPVLMSH
jgi:nucleotide-binding universal stress UspA family protein